MPRNDGNHNLSLSKLKQPCWVCGERDNRVQLFVTGDSKPHRTYESAEFLTTVGAS